MKQQLKQRRKQFLLNPKPPKPPNPHHSQSINLNSVLKVKEDKNIKKFESIIEHVGHQLIGKTYQQFPEVQTPNFQLHNLAQTRNEQDLAVTHRSESYYICPRRDYVTEAVSSLLKQLKVMMKQFQKIFTEFIVNNNLFKPEVRKFQNHFQQISKKLQNIQSGYAELKPILLQHVSSSAIINRHVNLDINANAIVNAENNGNNGNININPIVNNQIMGIENNLAISIKVPLTQKQIQMQMQKQKQKMIQLQKLKQEQEKELQKIRKTEDTIMEVPRISRQKQSEMQRQSLYNTQISIIEENSNKIVDNSPNISYYQIKVHDDQNQSILSDDTRLMKIQSEIFQDTNAQQTPQNQF